jgi:hypothetical protein
LQFHTVEDLVREHQLEEMLASVGQLNALDVLLMLMNY